MSEREWVSRRRAGSNEWVVAGAMYHIHDLFSLSLHVSRAHNIIELKFIFGYLFKNYREALRAVNLKYLELGSPRIYNNRTNYSDYRLLSHHARQKLDLR